MEKTNVQNVQEKVIIVNNRMYVREDIVLMEISVAVVISIGIGIIASKIFK